MSVVHGNSSDGGREGGVAMPIEYCRGCCAVLWMMIIYKKAKGTTTKTTTIMIVKK